MEPTEALIRRRFSRQAVLLAVVGFLFAALLPAAFARGNESVERAFPPIAIGALPAEAKRTIDLVRQGGPFPYERDGVVFGNFERLLPVRDRGYYREYTVSTPGLRHRGARRIVAGRKGELYYTDDHYRTFKRVRE